MTDWLDIRAPGRSGAELVDPQAAVVRVVSQPLMQEVLRHNQRADARLNSRVPDRSDARAAEICASVSHPHGEASGPGAWSFCTDAKNTRFGGTRSQTTAVLVSAFVFVCGDRGEAAHENESVNEDATNNNAQRAGSAELC